MCLRLDHGAAPHSSMKASSTPVHSVPSASQGYAQGYHSGDRIGVAQDSSHGAIQGSLLDLTIHSQLPVFSGTPCTQGLYVPARFPSGTVSHSGLVSRVSVPALGSRPALPMDSQSYPQTSSVPEASMDTQHSSLGGVPGCATMAVPDTKMSVDSHDCASGTRGEFLGLASAPVVAGLPKGLWECQVSLTLLPHLIPFPPLFPLLCFYSICIGGCSSPDICFPDLPT